MGTFLKDFESLKKSMPLLGSRGKDTENCDFGNYLYSSKNLYYCFDCSESSNSFYLFDCFRVTNSMDCCQTASSENCYQVADSASLYNCSYMSFCESCYDCFYCVSCENCHDCFGCVNLEHKQYCIFNQQYSKEEYFGKIEKLKRQGSETILAEVSKLEKKYPKVFSHAENNENSDFCNYVFNSVNSYYCFDSSHLEGCGYQFSSFEGVGCWDGTYNFKCEFCYESNDSESCYNSCFVDHCERCYDSAYLYECRDCHDCFGCAGLSHKSYCILNEQYDKEAYFDKMSLIKKELSWKIKA